MFNSGLSIGQTISNSDIVSIFKCGNMGGMRRSHATNTLVLVSDYTKGLYHDKWISGTLHYTGMGKRGNMDIDFAQNSTLAALKHNDVDAHLFEVMDPGEYIYCGHVELVGDPYTEIQPDENGMDRTVWMFPIRPVPENNVIKPALFVFVDMDDYRARGRRAEIEYGKYMDRRGWRNKPVRGQTKKVDFSPGSKLEHKIYGEGTVVKNDGLMITVRFPKEGTKTLNFIFCKEKEIIKAI